MCHVSLPLDHAFRAAGRGRFRVVLGPCPHAELRVVSDWMRLAGTSAFPPNEAANVEVHIGQSHARVRTICSLERIHVHTHERRGGGQDE